MCRLWFLSCIWVVPSLYHVADSTAPDGVAVTTNVPTESFRAVWITLAGGAWPKTRNKPGYDELSVRLTFRDGKGTSAWICSPLVANSFTTWIDQTDVLLSERELKGLLGGVTHTGLHNPQDRLPFAYTLDAKLVDGKLSGTFVGKVGDQAVTGKLTGVVVADTQSDALPIDQNWPRYYGATGGMEGPSTGVKMIVDLRKARPVWKSEETIPVAWGNAPDWRYGPHPILMRRLGGGAASPVVADGIVYQYYYMPIDGTEPARDYGGDQPERGWEAQKHRWGGGPIPKAILDFNAPGATDILVAMDAATGKTLWKAVCEKAGANVQTHKWRWWNPTPCVHNGVVYHHGYAGFVAAFDGKTGKQLWQYTGVHRPQTTTDGLGNYGSAWPGVMSAGPVVAGGHLIVSNAGDYRIKKPDRTVALNLKTGKPVWENTKITGNLHPWSHAGKDYVLVAGQKSGACLDATTGAEVFKLPPEACAVMEQCPVICGDYWLGESPGPEKDTLRIAVFRLKRTGVEKLWDVVLPLNDQRWSTLTASHVYLISPRGLQVYETETGRKTADLPQGDGHRTCLALVADQRLIIQPEGRHGSQGFKMFDLRDPANPKPLGAAAKERKILANGEVEFDNDTLWRPPHPFTTAYASHPITYPVVNGRIFIRGAGGVYCYDLREPAKK